MIEANHCRANKAKNGDSTQDPEAGWNVKTGSDGKRKSTYGYKAHIKRGYRNKPLDDQAKHFNRLYSGVRCTVERVFGVLKQHYGMAKARYLGLGRNRTRFELMCVAHNIKRSRQVASEK